MDHTTDVQIDLFWFCSVILFVCTALNATGLCYIPHGQDDNRWKILSFPKLTFNTRAIPRSAGCHYTEPLAVAWMRPDSCDARNAITRAYHTGTASTHWGPDKMSAVLQTLSNPFCCIRSVAFRLQFRWNLFHRAQLKLYQPWFR